MANDKKNNGKEVEIPKSAIDEQINFKEPDKVLTKENQDINENVGKFTSVKEFKADDNSGLNLSKKEEKKISKLSGKEVEINFSKFNKQKIFSDSKFGKLKAWLDNKLENKKSLILIWLFYFIYIAICLAGSICFIVFTDICLKHNSGTNHFEWMRNVALSGKIFSYVAACIPAIPLLVIVISWMAGINNVYKSLSFHLVFILILLISTLMLLVAIVLCGTYFGVFLPSWNAPN